MKDATSASASQRGWRGLLASLKACSYILGYYPASASLTLNPAIYRLVRLPKGGLVIDAVIRTGGKQFVVRAGSVLNVPTLDVAAGERVELRDVLMLSDGGNVT